MTESRGGTNGQDILRLTCAMFLIHLLVPLGLVLDILLSLHHQRLGGPHFAVLLVCGAWLAAGFFAFLLYGKNKLFLQRATGPLLAFCTVLLTLGVAEAGLRLLSPEKPGSIWEPGAHVVHGSNPPGLPGVYAAATFTANAQGLRGPAWPRDKGIYKIITVGGSTTECFVLDDTKEWPHLLMESLNARQKDHPVWVGNAGISGQTTEHHLLLLRNLAILSQANMLSILIGINDLQAAWSFDGSSTQGPLQEDAEDFLRKTGIAGAPPFPRYKRLRIYKLVRSAIGTFSPFAVRENTEGPGWFDRRRMRRAAGPQIPAPDISTGLQEYGARIREIARECRLRGLRCLFLTQPSVWREDLSPAEQKLLWFGWVGPIHTPRGFVSITDAARGMEAFNSVLREACAQLNLECFDLAAQVPKNSSLFYDEVHLTESGARIVAAKLNEYLLSTPPFLTAPSPQAREQSLP